MAFLQGPHTRGTNSSRRGQTLSRGNSGSLSNRDAKVSEPGKRQRFSPYKSHRNYRTIRGTDAGLNLRHFERSRRSRKLFGSMSDDMLAYILIGISAVICVVLLLCLANCVSGCIHGCSHEETPVVQTNEIDSRVEASTSENLTNQFTPVLDYADDITWIAAHAHEYSDERLPELAIREQSAAPFVRSILDSSKSVSASEITPQKGSMTAYYTWDSLWGNTAYGQGTIATDGSGLVSWFMIRTMLLGDASQTPTDFAEQATDYADDTCGTQGEFFAQHAKDAGLSIKEYTVSADNLKLSCDGEKKLALVCLKEGFTSPYQHWAVVTRVNKNGTASLYDPTSKTATDATWEQSKITDQICKLYAVSAASQRLALGAWRVA